MQSKGTFLALILLLFLFFSCTPNDQEGVAFIEKTPVIDGQLDEDLEYLDAKKFNYIWQFDNPVTDTVQVSYRMAYTPSHLYLYIETDVDSVSYHRRGYLWGDGYKILLGIPQKDSLTNEYYELSYSPSLSKEDFNRQRIFGYNFSQVRKKMTNASKSQEKALTGKSGFEALLAWDDIKPYHPWFLDEMGYNIYFAKGIESKEHGYITNGYSLVEDEGIWDEEVPKRNYLPISFQDPNSVIKKVIKVQPVKNNLQVGEPLQLQAVHIDKQSSKDSIFVTLSDSNSRVIISKTIAIQLDEVLKSERSTIEIGALKAGSYGLTVQNSEEIFVQEAIMIQPTIDFQKISATIQENKNDLTLGVTNTLQFKLNQISKKLSELKDYETGEAILKDWNLFNTKYELFNSSIDPYKNLTGPYRRAFQSKYDSTYQPYTIKLPVNYNPNKKYPLLVYLHGSGSDEQTQGLLNKARSGGNFIEIAPLGRDIYRAYAEDYSQKDIIEAIEDVSKYFAVDQNNIVIGGFSMGGYGALRTFYEHPELYKGVVVHAGHPNIANEWLDGEHPNFLDEKYVKVFSNIPVFIYHGRKDPALAVELIEEMSEKLTKAGALVTLSIVEENGHEYPDDKTNKLYFEWLNKTTNQ